MHSDTLEREALDAFEDLVIRMASTAYLAALWAFCPEFDVVEDEAP